MPRSAIKLGFFGAIAVIFGRAFHSLLMLMVYTFGVLALLAALLTWFWFGTTHGFI
jgi:hypothetical protein